MDEALLILFGIIVIVMMLLRLTIYVLSSDDRKNLSKPQRSLFEQANYEAWKSGGDYL